MSMISKRVSKYLIARQQRAARLKPLARPWTLAFLNVSRSVRPSTAGHGLETDGGNSSALVR
jgi:hypothetical protein